MPVTTARRGHALMIRMDRPSKRNAIDAEMAAGLDAAMNLLDDDPEVWVGILTGTETSSPPGRTLWPVQAALTPRGRGVRRGTPSTHHPLLLFVDEMIGSDGADVSTWEPLAQRFSDA